MSTTSTQPTGIVSSAARRHHGVAAIVEDGVITGIIGASAVAIWFFVFDAISGKAFWTPSLIGSVLFLGKRVEEVTSVNPTIVFAYSGLHGALFLLVGTAIAWMFSVVERNPQFGLVMVLLFALCQSVIFGFEVTIVPSLVGALGAWAVAVANLLSTVAMFWFLLIRRPEAMSRLRAGWNE